MIKVSCFSPLVIVSLLLFPALYSPLIAQQAETDNNYPLLRLAQGELPALPDYVPSAVFLNLDYSALQEMLRKQPKNAIIKIPNPLTEGNWTLNINLVEHPGAPFQLKAIGEHKRVVPQQYTHGLHYHGKLSGAEQSIVAISIFENEVHGLIVTQDGHFDLGHYGDRADDLYILYNSDLVNQLIPFKCGVDETSEINMVSDDRDAMAAELLTGCNFVTIYYECDFHMYNHFGGSTQSVANYVSALHNQVSILYEVWNIHLIISQINVWTVPDPYIPFTNSGQVLGEFGSEVIQTSATLGHLLSTRPAGMGGVAYLGVLCSPSSGNAFSNISTSFNNVPTYSWSVNVIAHEKGHNFGSPHTHNCSWNDFNSAIDGCGPQAGYSEGCTGPIPSGGGTIMSYCHLISGVGINFIEGFGAQPGALLQHRVLQANTHPFCNITSGLMLTDTLTISACGFLELDGSYYGSSGQYIHVVNPMDGCNELLFLDLEITPVNYIFDTICAGEVFTYENMTFDETGIFFLEAPDSLNCEGLALNLTVVNLMPEIEILDEDVIFATAYPNAVYEWIDCETGADLTLFASDNLFLVPGPGSYAVAVSLPGCTVISDCIDLTVSNVDNLDKEFTFGIVPNPNNGRFNLSWQSVTNLYAEVRIYNIAGKLVHQLSNLNLHSGAGSMEMNQSQLPAGTYTVQVITEEGFTNLPFVVIR